MYQHESLFVEQQENNTYKMLPISKAMLNKLIMGKKWYCSTFSSLWKYLPNKVRHHFDMLLENNFVFKATKFDVNYIFKKIKLAFNCLPTKWTSDKILKIVNGLTFYPAESFWNLQESKGQAIIYFLQLYFC